MLNTSDKTSSTERAITVSFGLPGLPPSPNQTKGAHWGKLHKIKTEWGEQIVFAALAAKRRERLRGLYDHAHIHFHISVGDNRRHDPDNLAWSVTKPCLDALKGLLIEDDNIDQVDLTYTFDRAEPRGFRVTLTGN